MSGVPADLLVVSPHLDDAVLSVGQLLAGHTTAAVATVASSTPRRGKQLTSYDHGCGFKHAAQAMSVRRGEDRDALLTIGAQQFHLGLIDSQYREGRPNTPAMIAQRVAEAARRSGATSLAGPLGLMHPDHGAASEATLQAAADLGLPVWLYEELPARVLWPESVPERLAGLAERGYQAEPDFIGTGDLAAKAEAVGCYASQAAPLGSASGGTYPHCVLVPERLWRVEL